jgi:hypothetical protein
MSKRATTHLKKLRKKDTDHLLQAALCAYLTEPSDLDLRISLTGAMHQSGWLINQIAPYLSDWDVEPDTWLARCFERHIQTFIGDPFATSALLFSSPQAFCAVSRQYFPTLVYAQTWKDGGTYYGAIFAAEWNEPVSLGDLAHRCIEVVWKDGADYLREVHYAKAISKGYETISGGAEQSDYLHGSCSHAYLTTAHLPHGFWRNPRTVVDLDPLDEVREAVKKLPPWVTG